MTWQILINHILSLFSLLVLGVTLPAIFVAIKHIWKNDTRKPVLK